MKTREIIQMTLIDKGIKSTELALGISRSDGYLSSIISGNVIPSKKSLYKILHFLNINYDQYFLYKELKGRSLINMIKENYPIYYKKTYCKFTNIPGYNNYKISKYGDIRKISNNKLLRQHCDSYNNLAVGIRDNNDKQTMERIHRLLAITFIPNPQNKKHVIFKDKNRLNLILDNIVWANRSDKEYYEQRAAKGTQIGISKLDSGEVLEIRELYNEGESGFSIARKFKVSTSTIYNIINGVTWKHVK